MIRMDRVILYLRFKCVRKCAFAYIYLATPMNAASKIDIQDFAQVKIRSVTFAAKPRL